VVLDPEYFLSDFEQAILTAVSFFFPGIDNKTCMFHLGQVLWRRVQFLGLVKDYGTDAEFSLLVKKLLALSFLTPAEILQYFPILKEEAPAKAEDLLQFFDENYVRGPVVKIYANGSSIRNRPRCPPKIWSIAENNALGMPRTSNSVEAWHRRWENLVNVSHAGLYKFIEEINKEINSSEGTIQSVLAGQPKPPQKKEIMDAQKRIQNVISNKNNLSLADFVTSVI
jgi:hypothetical protein